MLVMIAMMTVTTNGYAGFVPTQADLVTLREQARQGNKDAQHILQMYYGSGGLAQPQRDDCKAPDAPIVCLEKAAKGDAEAQYNLGYLYDTNDKPNYKEALKWLRKSADQNNADAEYALGIMYSDGEGVPRG